jgi:Pyridoxamine 5'-phosphate oxidase
MSQILGDKLPDRALTYLQVGHLVIIATVDEEGRPTAAPMSWLTALDRQTIRIAISPDVGTYHNILQNERVVLSLIGSGMRMSISGCARVIAETMEEVPFPMAMVEVLVDEVKDDSVIGRSVEGEVIKWEDRRRTVSDIRVAKALRNTPLEDDMISSLEPWHLPYFQE